MFVAIVEIVLKDEKKDDFKTWIPDSNKTLSKKIIVKEHKIYPKAVELFAKKKLLIKGRKVRILN